MRARQTPNSNQKSTALKVSSKLFDERSTRLSIARLSRELIIRRAREDFYVFCRLLSPDFYTPSRPHLKKLCSTLQSFREGLLLTATGAPARKLMINIPPRHGKTRTLVLFSAWCFGQNPAERIIATSYGDDIANDFSRYTRNTIQEERNDPDDIVYADVFPATRVQRGDASFAKWSLDKQYFSYLGAGIWSGITGKGATLLIEDDLVKDFEEALNETRLAELHRQRTGTLLQRKEEGCLEVLMMTRWATDDPCGRILDDPEEAAKWYVLKMEAQDAAGEMLCPELLSEETYLDLRRNIPAEVFRANYHQEPVDIKGRLYTEIKTYAELPRTDDGGPLFDRVINYTDTADEGNDALVSISAREYRGEAWITDVYMTRDGMEKTEPETARRLVENGVTFARIESNNGGRGFARAVERIIGEQMKAEAWLVESGDMKPEDRRWNRTSISWFHQSANKRARIISMSNYVMQHVYLPFNWADRWPEFYRSIMTYQREGRNQHDDAPDALTGIAEVISLGRPSIRLIG